MRITSLTAYHVCIPLKRTISHASHTRRSTDSLIVCCQLSDGTLGWGEGLPREYVTGETIETVFDQLSQTEIQKQLDGEFQTLESAIDLCLGFQLGGTNENQRDCFGNSVRCAIELSILDAASRFFNVPFSDITDLLPETIEIRTSKNKVRYSGFLPSSGALQECATAWMYRLSGFKQVKVKVGMPGRDDFRSLYRIRKSLGPKVDLRIDANEAWSCENLVSKVQPLLPLEISSLEQPVPHAEILGLTQLRPKINIPIMLDESLCSLSDAVFAIENETCDLFNIRLSKCGGFLNSLLIAAVAHRANIGYQLGCLVGETGILSAAGRHFATSVKNLRYLEGSYDRHLVKERLTHEDLTFRLGGTARALNGLGLGITIDQRSLKRVTIKQETWNF